MKTFITASAPEATDEDLARLAARVDALTKSISATIAAAIGPALKAELAKALGPLSDEIAAQVANTKRPAAAPAFGFKLPEGE